MGGGGGEGQREKTHGKTGVGGFAAGDAWKPPPVPPSSASLLSFVRGSAVCRCRLKKDKKTRMLRGHAHLPSSLSLSASLSMPVGLCVSSSPPKKHCSASSARACVCDCPLGGNMQVNAGQNWFVCLAVERAPSSPKNKQKQNSPPPPCHLQNEGAVALKKLRVEITKKAGKKPCAPLSLFHPQRP